MKRGLMRTMAKLKLYLDFKDFHTNVIAKIEILD